MTILQDLGFEHHVSLYLRVCTVASQHSSSSARTAEDRPVPELLLTKRVRYTLTPLMYSTEHRAQHSLAT